LGYALFLDQHAPKTAYISLMAHHGKLAF